MLLRELLSARSDCCVVLHKDKIMCSCGKVFREISAAENHLVAFHDKGSSESNLLASLRDLLSTLNRGICGADVEVSEPCHLACLPESQLDLEGSAGAKEVPCPLCHEVVSDFYDMQDHFMVEHPRQWTADRVTVNGSIIGQVLTTKHHIRTRDNTNWPLRCHCPIPGCKYHVLNCPKGGPASSNKSFSSVKLLRQHYVKVHAGKRSVCQECKESFSTAATLARHMARKECNAKFSCRYCTASYKSYENLQTHGRRKGHPISSREESKAPVVVINRNTAHPTTQQPRRLRKILPRPSKHHMNAAIALSELGLQQPDAASLEVGQKRKDQHLARGSGKKSRKDESSLQLEALKPSVRDASTGCMADFDPEGPQKKSQDVLIGTSTAPKLGDVEQFSTETQTQEVGLFSAETQTCATDLDSILLTSKPSREEQGNLGLGREDSCTTSSSSLLDDSIRHMETQFDLDDILCSNYTQTSARMSSSILPMDAASAVCSIETQTMDFMFEDEEFAGGGGGKRNIETAHSHTQT